MSFYFASYSDRRSRRTVSGGRDPHGLTEEGLLSQSSGRKSSGDELTETPMPCLPALLVGRREGLEGKGILRAYFTSHYPPLILLVINSLCKFKLSLFFP